MGKKRGLLGGLFILIFLLGGIGYQSEIIDYFHILIEENEKNPIRYGVRENMRHDLRVDFCPGRSCYDIYAKSFLEADNSIKCAFYEFDQINLSKVLKMYLKE